MLQTNSEGLDPRVVNTGDTTSGLWPTLQRAARALVDRVDVLRAKLTTQHGALTEARERSQTCASCAMLREALAQVVYT